MKLTDYRFGAIKVGNREYTHDIIVFKGSINSWWRRQGHEVVEEDIKDLLKEQPEIIIFGTGYSGCMQPSAALKASLKEKNIKMHALPTADAVKLYNEMENKYSSVAIALHLTC